MEYAHRNISVVNVLLIQILDNLANTTKSHQKYIQSPHKRELFFRSFRRRRQKCRPFPKELHREVSLTGGGGRGGGILLLKKRSAFSLLWRKEVGDPSRPHDLLLVSASIILAGCVRHGFAIVIEVVPEGRMIGVLAVSGIAIGMGRGGGQDTPSFMAARVHEASTCLSW